MRVLEIDTELTWRGGERQTLFTLAGLRARGVAADLLCRRGSPLAARAAELPGGAVHALPGAAVLGWLARHGGAYDLLHAQAARAQSLALLARPWHRRPVVYTRRVNFVPRGPLARWKYRATDRLVANNGAAREILLRQGFGPVAVIPSAVEPRPLDLPRAEALRAALPLAGRRVLGAVGDLVPQKDPLTLVRAIGELAARGHDVALLHFGGQQERRAVLAEIERLGLHGRIHLLGHRDGVEDFFPLFEALLVAATPEEGFVSVVLDAFAYGVPVVAARAGGLLESVGERGILCPPGDAGALADGVERLFADAPLRAALIARARREVGERFSVAAMTEAYHALFAELLAERRGERGSSS